MSDWVIPHEAAHAAAGLLHDLPVDGIELRPERGTAGWTAMPIRNREVVLGDLVATLAGGMVAGPEGTGCEPGRRHGRSRRATTTT